MCNQLGLPAPSANMELSTANGVSNFLSGKHVVRISSIDDTFSSTIHLQSCPHRLTGNYQAKDWSVLKDRYPPLKDIPFYPPVEPYTILIY